MLNPVSPSFLFSLTRLVNLSAVLCLQKISTGVARRFPSYDHMVEAGLMTHREKVKMEKMDVTVENIHQTTWYPLQWAQVLVFYINNQVCIHFNIKLLKLKLKL